MTASNWPYCLQTILGYEGGFVDNPQDQGGATNLGITLATLQEWRPGSSVSDLKALTATDDLVQHIYLDGYWDEVQADDLPSGVDLIVFDQAVNSGPHKAAQALQRAMRVHADGIIGPATLAAVAASDALALVNAISSGREAFYRSLPTFAEFGKGWLNRLADVTAKAQTLASGELNP